VYENVEESVHLSDFPDVSGCDSCVLEDVEKVRAMIAQVLKLRNEHGLKVKQPLSVLYVAASIKGVAEYDAVIQEELNIKEIVCLDDFDVLSCKYVTLNFQVAGRLLKNDLNKVKNLLDSLSSAEHEGLAVVVEKGYPVQLPGYENDIPADCFNILKKDKANIARSATMPVAINIEITPALKKEGMYRELLRHCQLLRKEAGFSISDRVALAFCTESPEIQSVIDAYAEDIVREALAAIVSVPKPIMCKEVDLDYGKVVVSVGK